MIRRTAKVLVPEFEPATFPSLMNTSTEKNSVRLNPMALKNVKNGSNLTKNGSNLMKNGSNLMNISEFSEDPIGYSDRGLENLLQRSNFDDDENFYEMEFDGGGGDEFGESDFDPNPETYFAHLQPKINAALKRARETGLREILS